MKKRNILIAVDSIDVNTSSGAKANMGFIHSLHSAGYHLTVLHYSHKEIQLADIPTHCIREKRFNSLFLLSRAQRILQRLTGFNVNKIIEQLLGFSITHFNDVKSIKSALKEYLKKKKPDFIITLSQAASFRPHFAMLDFKADHSKWIAYIHDPYPHKCYPRPYDWVEPGHAQKYKLMHQVLNACSYSAYPSLWLAKWMSTYYLKHNISNALIIPHQKIKVPELNESMIPDKLKVINKRNFTLLHAGSLMDARNPVSLTQAFIEFTKELEESERSGVYLVFIGLVSSYHPYLRAQSLICPQIIVAENYLDFNITFHLQHFSAANIILEADAPFSPFLPGKFTHCIQANNPIFYLGPQVNECIRILGSDYPFQAEIDDVKKIRQNIFKLYREWKLSPSGLNLDRADIDYYVSSEYLTNCLENING